MADKQSINIKTTVNGPIEKVWKCWNEPKHIKRWNNASEDWHTTISENDLKIGGKFLSRMESKDGTMGFDFSGTYDAVILYDTIAYTLGDGRKVKIVFGCHKNETEVTETFEAESENSLEMQQAGWQSILDNFKRYVEEIELQ